MPTTKGVPHMLNGHKGKRAYQANPHDVRPGEMASRRASNNRRSRRLAKRGLKVRYLS